MFETNTVERSPEQVRIDAEHRRSREKLNKFYAETDARLKAEKERAAKLIPSVDDRRQAMLRGVTKLIAKCKKIDEVNKADKLTSLAATMADALTEYRNITQELTSKQPTPLADAITKAAKQLCKVLPHCFNDEADAVDFAARLPLTEARASQVKANEAFVKLGRKRGLAQAKFEAAYGEGVRLGTGSADDKALREVEILGTEY